MQDFFQEDTLGKAYDSRLMRRLLTYARPFRRYLALAIALMLVITVADLVRPYLVRIAIDEHLLAYDEPWAAFVPGTEPAEGVLVPRSALPGAASALPGDVVLVRGRDVPAGAPVLGWYQMVAGDRSVPARYMLIEGVVEGDEEAERFFVRTPSGYALSVDGRLYPAVGLDPSLIEALRQPDLTAVARIAWIYLGLVLLTFALSYAQVYILHYTGQRIVYNIRQQIYSHLQRMPIRFFDRNPVGRLVTRATNDTEALNEMFTNVVVNLFKDVLLLTGILVVMLRVHWQLALVSLCVTPLLLVVSILFRRYAREAYREVRAKLARINATLAENIAGMRITQIFHQEERQYKRFEAINTEHYKAMMKELRVFALFRPAVEFFSSLALSLIIWYGGGRVVQGSLEFGVLYLFVQYMQMFFQPITDLTEQYNIMQAAMASAERIFLILDTPPEEDEPDAKPVPYVRGEIEFDHVWFAYNDEDWVLKDVTFHVKPGETVALVGATGAGKTSITNLINRFYDIQKGVIRIDGQDIRTLKRRDLRRHIGIVLQDVFLFTGDIEGNITLGNNQISPAKVREAARLVNAEKFIERLPGGYKAPVMERGASFSAGQRQLLAFARALAYDPAILILDEATSNIDTETEQLIQEALKKLIEGRTTIIIAHRLSTIQHADKIIVLHKGEIREMGTHQELLKKRGLYYRLYQLQYKDQLLPDGEGPRTVETAGQRTVERADQKAMGAG
ncbi:MAG: ABC transporter ATP-binding protein [Limnochordales bacterium]